MEYAPKRAKKKNYIFLFICEFVSEFHMNISATGYITHTPAAGEHLE